MSAVAGAYLGKHEKFGFAHFLCYFEECIVERLVENQARHVSPGVNTEAIDTHFDEFAVGINDVVEHSRIFGVEIDTIACNLHPLASEVVPVAITEVVPIVVSVVILAIGVFHLRQSSLILVARSEVEITFGEAAVGVEFHALIDVAKVGCLIFCEHRAEGFLAKITGVVEDHIEDEFHVVSMNSVDKFLKSDILGEIAAIHFFEIHGVIAVIVISAGILDHRCNPHGGESERFYVVEFLDETFEIAAPSRVSGVVLLAVPALHVVRIVAIEKTSGD